MNWGSGIIDIRQKPRSSSSKRKSQKQAECPPVITTNEKWLTDDERQEIREAFLTFATPEAGGSKGAFSFLLLFSSPEFPHFCSIRRSIDELLSIKQTKKALNSLSIPISREEIQFWVRNELGGQDLLDWHAFSKLATLLAIQRNKASLAFSLIDQDQKGVIVVEDLRKVANDLGEDMTDEELQEMMELDHASDGLLTLEDFVKIARQVKL